MRRREMRGFEWAGLRLRIEVPHGVEPERDWQLPPAFVALPDDSQECDLQITFDPRCDAIAGAAETTWLHEGEIVEAGRVGPDRWLRLVGDGRTVVADPDFRQVHVGIPTTASCATSPIAHPLADLILIHRALEQGAIALRASASLRDGSALVLLGDSGFPVGSDDAALWQGWLLLRPEAVGVRVSPLPSTRCMGRAGQAWRDVYLSGLHVTDSLGGEADGVRLLDSDTAASELLRYAFVPIGSPRGVDQAVVSATGVARRVPVVQLPSCDGRRFAWQQGRSPLDALLPAGA